MYFFLFFFFIFFIVFFFILFFFSSSFSSFFLLYFLLFFLLFFIFFFFFFFFLSSLFLSSFFLSLLKISSSKLFPLEYPFIHTDSIFNLVYKSLYNLEYPVNVDFLFVKVSIGEFGIYFLEIRLFVS